MNLRLFSSSLFLLALGIQSTARAGGESHGTNWGKFKLAQLKTLSAEQRQALDKRTQVVADYIRGDLMKHTLSYFTYPATRTFDDPKTQNTYDFLIRNGVLDRLKRGVPVVTSRPCLEKVIRDNTVIWYSQPATGKTAPEDEICLNPQLIALMSFDELLKPSAAALRPLTFGVMMHELTRFYDKGSFQLDEDHDFEMAMLSEGKNALLLEDLDCPAQSSICALTRVVHQKAETIPYMFSWDVASNPKVSLEIAFDRDRYGYDELCFEKLRIAGQQLSRLDLKAAKQRAKKTKQPKLEARFEFSVANLPRQILEVSSEMDKEMQSTFSKIGETSSEFPGARTVQYIHEWSVVADGIWTCPQMGIKILDQNGRVLTEGVVPRREITSNSKNFVGTSDPSGRIDSKFFFLEPYKPAQFFFVPSHVDAASRNP